ncbi:ATP-binding protein [Acinetobacter sp. VNK23]|uniref:histidine kinase n=1 Tax=Acinetobacter corruptisaponis TaxID=3045147 RepID=A0ABY8S4J8_9GAMM|nr:MULTISPECIES: ATP-binding protein [Acinetobacter]MDM1020373.1 ATP-binding protein [Acinetobacter thutiue]WHP05884.1 ATP-binding protein [Acinetobacter sp. KCTC 92772]
MSAVLSIKKQVVKTSLTALIIALIVSSILGYLAIKHEVGELFDATLIDNTRIIKGLIDSEHTKQNWADLQNSLDETLLEHIDRTDQRFNGHAYEKKIAIQVWTREGDLILRSASAPNHALAPLKEGLVRFDGDDYNWMVYTVWLPNKKKWLTVAERSDIRQELSRNVEASLLLALIIALFCAIGLLKIQLKKAFAPLVELGEKISQRDFNDLSALELPNSPDELKPVITELNDLFQRVDSSLEREKRFLADAAHELRTPLTVIKLQVEQALLQPESRQMILERLLASVDRNQQVVEQMLLLARLEAGQMLIKSSVVLFSALIRETIAQLMPLAFKRNIEFDLEVAEIGVNGDSALLLSLLRNLFDNALRHSPDDSHINIRLFKENQQVVFEVVDSGVGINPQFLGEVTGRFSQGGGSDVGASGLGLAIVSEIAHLHGMKLTLENHEERGLMVRLVWQSQ